MNEISVKYDQEELVELGLKTAEGEFTEENIQQWIKERQGGVGSILKTFFHIIDVEYSWIQVLKGDEVIDPNYEDYKSLERVMHLSSDYRERIQEFYYERCLNEAR